MIRIALVSYFNTRPFMDGLQHAFEAEELQLQEVPPSECALRLQEGKCEMALVPVGALSDFHGISVMKDHCLGADGRVDSVFLFSQVPVQEAESLVLDPHSRSSNGLAAVLLKEYWDRELPMVQPKGERFSQIQGKACGVAIGDKAFALKDQFPYVYDLAEIWKRYSGLPFVFAVWAYKADAVAPGMVERVRKALEWGRNHRHQSAQRWALTYGYQLEDAVNYLTNSISYEFDSAKHEAMKKYFHLLQEIHSQVPQSASQP
jgi:chorismate dehydratase